MKRSLALDVFRGLTVALMILVNNPGSWSHVYAPFLHASWHGLTPTDLVFPFFLFAVGNAQSLVLPRLLENGGNFFFEKVFKRALIIFFIGFFLNWYPFMGWIGDDLKLRTWTWLNAEGGLVGVRILGVLQRIGLAYGFSATLIYLFPKKVFSLSMALLILYWILCVAFGSGDIYGLEGWFGTHIDRTVLGNLHLYQGEGVAFDPEGIMSTLPSIAHVMLGFWAGQMLMTKQSLSKASILLLTIGGVWHLIHPINKKIWTGSYVLVTIGLALLLLVLLVKVLDEKKYRSNVIYFFEAFGKNPLFIYVLSVLLPKTLALIRIPSGEKFLTPFQWFYETLCSKFPGPPQNGSLFYAIVLVAFYGVLTIWLDKKKIYIKV